MTQPTLLTLTVPPDAEPGIDSLTFHYQGQELEILVPSDAKPGDVLEVHVGSSAETPAPESNRDNDAPAALETNEPKSGITVVPLNPFASLHLPESIPPADDPSPHDTGDGTNAVVWPSGILLAQALTCSPDILLDMTTTTTPCLRALELGSGSGVVGLALAHAFSLRADLRADIVLTDKDDCAVQCLRENIRKNRPVFEDRSARVSVQAATLSWGDALPSRETFEAVLGSDLLYDTCQSYEPLVRTMCRHLRGEGRVVLAVRWRKPPLERAFFRVAARFGLEFVLWDKVLEEAPEWSRRCPCRLGWEEYGDPECEASNAFFHETVVSVGGETKSLAEVRESDLEGMSEEEYVVFEEVQMQIYVGRWRKEWKSCGVGDDRIPRKRDMEHISKE